MLARTDPEALEEFGGAEGRRQGRLDFRLAVDGHEGEADDDDRPREQPIGESDRPGEQSGDDRAHRQARGHRSEEHTSELQSLMRISYAVFCLKKKKKITEPT